VAVLGIASLMFWSLLIIVTLKYVVLIMRADNEASVASCRCLRWCSAGSRKCRAGAGPSSRWR